MVLVCRLQRNWPNHSENRGYCGKQVAYRSFWECDELFSRTLGSVLSIPSISALFDSPEVMTPVERLKQDDEVQFTTACEISGDGLSICGECHRAPPAVLL